MSAKVWKNSVHSILYLEFKHVRANFVEPDEVAHYEPSHLALLCLRNLLLSVFALSQLNIPPWFNSAWFCLYMLYVGEMIHQTMIKVNYTLLCFAPFLQVKLFSDFYFTLPKFYPTKIGVTC